MTEQWKDIPGWEGYYSASDQGGIRSEPRTITRSDGVVQFHKGRVLRDKINGNGRPTVQLARNGKMTPYLVHRLVALTWVPNPDNHRVVRHWDDNPLNNTAANLLWGTFSENQLDRIRNGIYRNGSENRTHCVNGHAFTEDNIYRVKSRPGQRICRTCAIERSRQQRSKEVAPND